MPEAKKPGEDELDPGVKADIAKDAKIAGKELRSQRDIERGREVVGNAKEAVGNMFSQMKERGGAFLGRVKEGIGNFGRGVKERLFGLVGKGERLGKGAVEKAGAAKEWAQNKCYDYVGRIARIGGAARDGVREAKASCRNRLIEFDAKHFAMPAFEKKAARHQESADEKAEMVAAKRAQIEQLKKDIVGLEDQRKKDLANRDGVNEEMWGWAFDARAQKES